MLSRMRASILSAIALSLPLASCTEAPETRSLEQEIIGGTGGQVGEFPTTVAISNGGLCTGTLIAPDLVLTAAHCILPSLLGASSQAEVTAQTQVILDNADDLADALQLEYNKARQLSITNEMLDIAGGAEALAQSRGR